MSVPSNDAIVPRDAVKLGAGSAAWAAGRAAKPATAVAASTVMARRSMLPGFDAYESRSCSPAGAHHGGPCNARLRGDAFGTALSLQPILGSEQDVERQRERGHQDR